MRNTIIAILMLGLPPTYPGAAQAGSDEIRTELTVTQVIDSARRVQRMNLENARLWLSGIRSMNNPSAMLELALLLGFGHEDIRDPERAVTELESLAKLLSTEVVFESESAELLGVFEQILGVQAEQQELLQARTGRLEACRAAHAETREKLESLRAIEREIGERSDAAGKDGTP